MKKKKLIILAIQAVLIIVFTIMFMSYSSSKVSPTDVLVYTRPIADVNVAITETDVRVVSVPRDAVTSDMATELDDVVGKHVESKVYSGQYVYTNQLVEMEDIDVFQTMDLGEYRKISLPINLVEGFSGNIRKGDKVDLVFTGEGTVEDEEGYGATEKFLYSRVFLQDVLVYSVNTEDGYKFIDQSFYSPADSVTTDEEGNEIVEQEQKLEIITLAVTLEQAEEITTRMAAGNIKFLGRFADSESYNTLGYVLGEYEKKFSGQGSAETGNVLVEEDNFDEID